MSKRRYLTGKEVQAMMQAVCYGATEPEIIVLFCWHIGMGCVLVNCLICIIRILTLMKVE